MSTQLTKHWSLFKNTSNQSNKNLIVTSDDTVAILLSRMTTQPTVPADLSYTPDDRAVELFREYLRIKSVHPKPDYDGTNAFLKRIADELQLPYKITEMVTGKPIFLMKWEGDKINTVSHCDLFISLLNPLISCLANKNSIR